MKTSTLVLAAAIATAVYAETIPRERFSRKSLASSNDKRVDVIAGNGKKLRRQEDESPAVPAVGNGTALVVEPADTEEPEAEEEEEEEEESESVSNILLLQFPNLYVFGCSGTHHFTTRSRSLTNSRNPRAVAVKRKTKERKRKKRRKKKKKNPRQERHRNQEKHRPRQTGWRQNNLRP